MKKRKREYFYEEEEEEKEEEEEEEEEEDEDEEESSDEITEEERALQLCWGCCAAQGCKAKCKRSADTYQEKTPRRRISKDRRRFSSCVTGNPQNY